MTLSADIHWRLGEDTAHANLVLKPGITALIGPSGAGKSSLARCLAGLNPIIKGHITLSGEALIDTEANHNLPPHLRRIAYLAQAPSLFPHLTIRQNILYGTTSNWSPALEDMTDRLDITRLVGRMPHTLSGGEARRVTLARSIASGPACMILDEPFTGLDPKSARAVRQEILTLAETHMPILLISHNTDMLLATADRGYLINKGHILTEGPIGPLLDTPIARELLGDTFGGTLVSGHYQGGRVQIGPHSLSVPDTSLVSGPVCLQVRSKDVALAQDPVEGSSIRNQIPVTVSGVTKFDSDVLVHLAITETDQSITSLITQDAFSDMQATPGQPLIALIKAAALTTFDPCET